MPRDVLFRDATVWTAEPGEAEGACLLVSDGRVARVGARIDAPAGAEVVECGGGFVMPAFVDAHTHLVQHGVALMRLQLASAGSLDEALQMVRERAKLTPDGGWVVGGGWDETKWPEGRMPTREDLDRAAPGHPVLLSRVDMHMGVLNTAGLRAAGLESADGALREEAFYRALEAVEPSPETKVRAVQAASRRAWELGIASCHVIADVEDLAAIEAARRAGHLGVRASLYFRDPDFREAKAGGDAWVRTNGCKLFADGSIGSRTALVARGYAHDADHKGEPVYAPGELAARAKEAAARGLQLAIHCIGDLAVEEALSAIEALGDRAGRHRLEHAELFTDEHARRMAEAGVVASMQPNFIGEWGHPGQMYERRLGAWAVGAHNRLTVLREAGVEVAFGSDHMPWGPLYGVHCAANAPTAAQRLPVEEALRAYTLGSARAGFAEAEVGSLAPGKLADVLVLDADPRRDPARVRERRVRALAVDGRLVLRR